jgi:hypothetical protein
MNVPDLADATTFPNLVVNRSGRANKNRSGAWKSGSRPLLSGLQDTMYELPLPANFPPMLKPFNQSAAQDHSSREVLLNLAKQLDRNRKWRDKLEVAREAEKKEQQALCETVNTLRIELEEEKVEMKKEFAASAQVLGQLTAGQIDIQKSMASRDQQFTAMRDEITALTASVRELLHIRTSTSIHTPPRLLRTDSDMPSSDSAPEQDSDSSGTDQKRSPDRSPSKQNPRVSKFSRTTEGMITDEDPSAHQP